MPAVTGIEKLEFLGNSRGNPLRHPPSMTFQWSRRHQPSQPNPSKSTVPTSTKRNPSACCFLEKLATSLSGLVWSGSCFCRDTIDIIIISNGIASIDHQPQTITMADVPNSPSGASLHHSDNSIDHDDAGAQLQQPLSKATTVGDETSSEERARMDNVLQSEVCKTYVWLKKIRRQVG